MTIDKTHIVSFAIYPKIGIARVGNVAKVVIVEPRQPSPFSFEDADATSERQYVRFRIFGLNSEGAAVREITAEDGCITWHVHLENLKSGWQQLSNTMATNPLLASVNTSTMSSKIIDHHGTCSISGRNQFGQARYRFEVKGVLGMQVTLGELLTDDLGRLVVLGYPGTTTSFNGRNATGDQNDNEFFDDASDGPVMATVNIDGYEHKAESAMVIVASNYGPGLYKVLRNLWRAIDASTPAKKPSGKRAHLPLARPVSA